MAGGGMRLSEESVIPRSTFFLDESFLMSWLENTFLCLTVSILTYQGREQMQPVHSILHSPLTRVGEVQPGEWRKIPWSPEWLRLEKTPLSRKPPHVASGQLFLSAQMPPACGDAPSLSPYVLGTEFCSQKPRGMRCVVHLYLEAK